MRPMDTDLPEIGPDTNLADVVPIRAGTQSKEWMQAMTQKRLAKIKAGDRSAVGGRRRIRLTKDEIEAVKGQAIADALGTARASALAELEKMLTSKDSGDRRFAVGKILEYTDGKPTQRVETEHTGQPTVVVYETAALPPAFVPQALDAADSG